MGNRGKSTGFCHGLSSPQPLAPPSRPAPCACVAVPPQAPRTAPPPPHRPSRAGGRCHRHVGTGCPARWRPPAIGASRRAAPSASCCCADGPWRCAARPPPVSAVGGWGGVGVRGRLASLSPESFSALLGLCGRRWACPPPAPPMRRPPQGRGAGGAGPGLVVCLLSRVVSGLVLVRSAEAC